MYRILRHKITTINSENVINIYLDHRTAEFSEEFLTNAKSLSVNLTTNVKNYIEKNIPNAKAIAVNVMVGSLLLASIPFADINSVKAPTIPDPLENKFSIVETIPSAETFPFINTITFVDTSPIVTNLSGLNIMSIPSGSPVATTSSTIYSVIYGDTLFKIAKKYDVSIVTLKAVNNLTSDMIYVGQKLVVPIQVPDIYTVKSGDTLFKIAKAHGVAINDIKIANNLSSDTIYIGQNLKLIVEKDQMHIVKHGDTLYKIASRYNVSLDKLQTINSLKSSDIYVGQSLDIPNTHIVSNISDILVLANKKNSLPQSYVPQVLTVPNVKFSFNEYSDKKLMQSDAASALENLFNQGKREGVNLYAISGYRSYTTQKNIFYNKLNSMSYEEANRFSAFPGESEHQTGLAMDVTSPSVGYAITQRFGDSIEGIWLKNNAHHYGFIIRYEKGNESITGYQYEPWHIRYVGVKAATHIYNNQITLEQYLGKI